MTKPCTIYKHLNNNQRYQRVHSSHTSTMPWSFFVDKAFSFTFIYNLQPRVFAPSLNLSSEFILIKTKIIIISWHINLISHNYCSHIYTWDVCEIKIDYNIYISEALHKILNDVQMMNHFGILWSRLLCLNEL